MMFPLCIRDAVLDYQNTVDNIVRQGQKGVIIPEI